MQYLSLALIALYLFALKLIAWRTKKQSSESQEDFFLHARSLRGPLLWATVLATAVNSLAFTAVPALVYQGGVLFLYMWLVVFGLAFLLYSLGPKLCAYAATHGKISQGELFGHYFKSQSIAYLTAVIAVLSTLPFLCVQLAGMAKVLTTASSGVLNYETSLLLLACSTGLYLYFGGSRAVVASDLLQGALFFILLLFTAALFSYWTGGVPEALNSIQQQRPELLSFTSSSALRFLDNALSWPLAFFLWPQLFQRVFMAKDQTAIKDCGKATAILFGITMIAIMIIGICITAHFPAGILSPDTLVAEMFQKFWPSATSLIVLAVVALGMSTLDSGLLAITAIISRDLRHSNSLSGTRVLALAILFLLSLLSLSETARNTLTPLVTLGASLASLLIWPTLGLTHCKWISANHVLTAYTAGLTAITLSALNQPQALGPGLSSLLASTTAIALTTMFQTKYRRRPKQRETVMPLIPLE